MYTHAVVQQLEIPFGLTTESYYDYGEMVHMSTLDKGIVDSIVQLCKSIEEADAVCCLLKESSVFKYNQYYVTEI